MGKFAGNYRLWSVDLSDATVLVVVVIVVVVEVVVWVVVVVVVVSPSVVITIGVWSGVGLLLVPIIVLRSCGHDLSFAPEVCSAHQRRQIL